MSTWDWNTVMVYDSTGANVGADGARTGTLTDNAAGDFFDTTEEINGLISKARGFRNSRS